MRITEINFQNICLFSMVSPYRWIHFFIVTGMSLDSIVQKIFMIPAKGFHQGPLAKESWLTKHEHYFFYMAMKCAKLSGSLLLIVGHHDFPCISFPCSFWCICHSSCIGHLVHPSSFLATRFSSFSLLMTRSKKVAWCLHILLISDLVG